MVFSGSETDRGSEGPLGELFEVSSLLDESESSLLDESESSLLELDVLFEELLFVDVLLEELLVLDILLEELLKAVVLKLVFSPAA